MSKNALKFKFIWKRMKIETQTGYFLVAIIYSGQSLDFRTSHILAKFIVQSRWQRAYISLTLGPLPLKVGWPYILEAKGG
jgi:hypothetical protein